MSVKVYVYDSRMRSLSGSKIEILVRDSGGGLTDSQMNSYQGATGYGAVLKSPKPDDPFSVMVDDLAGIYAPTEFRYLNGKLSARLDVCLYPLPVGKGGGGNWGGDDPDDYSDRDDNFRGEEITRYIDLQVREQRWTTDEGTGVRQLTELIVRVSSGPLKSTDLNTRMRRWSLIARKLGIDIDPDRFDDKGPRSFDNGPKVKTKW